MGSLVKPEVSNRSRILESNVYAAQQRSVLADVREQIGMINAEIMSLMDQKGDLEKIESAINSGIIILEGTVNK